MRELYPQDSKEYRSQVNRKMLSDNKDFVMCFRNIFDNHICKTKKSEVLAKEHFFVPISDMETLETYNKCIETLQKSHFHKPLMAISNVLPVRESVANISPQLSQIYIGGLIVDNKCNLLLVREDGKYSVPNYKLRHTEAVYTHSITDLMSEAAFENLDRDIDIYPTIEGDNQSFDMINGIIVNTNKGDFEYVNKVLFLIVYRVDDFSRLTIKHKEDSKEAVILPLKEAAALLEQPETINPWMDYIISSLL